MNRNKNMKATKIFSLYLVVLLGCGRMAYAKTQPNAPGIPPVIEKVEFSPQNPKAGDEVKVTAVTYSDAKQTEDMPADVVLHYSIDAGKTWEDAAMEQSEDDKKMWTAAIPSQSDGTQVVFYVSVTDDAGNVAAEAPPFSSDAVEKDTHLPKDAAWERIYDDTDKKETVDYVDMTNMYFTYDADYFYFKFVFQGDIDSLTSDALYVVWFWNMDNKKEGEDLFKAAHALLYFRPKLSAVAESGLPRAGIVNTNGDLTNNEFSATVKFDAEIRKNTLYWRVARKDIRDTPRNKLRMYFETGTGYREDKIQFWWSQELNWSGMVHVDLQSHGYTVGK